MSDRVDDFSDVVANMHWELLIIAAAIDYANTLCLLVLSRCRRDARGFPGVVVGLSQRCERGLGTETYGNHGA